MQDGDRINERGYYPVNNFHVYVLRKNDSQSYPDLQNAALNQSNQAAGSNPEFRIHLADGRAAGIDISNFVNVDTSAVLSNQLNGVLIRAL